MERFKVIQNPTYGINYVVHDVVMDRSICFTIVKADAVLVCLALNKQEESNLGKQTKLKLDNVDDPLKPHGQENINE